MNTDTPELRVLVVDDNEDAATSLAVFLEILGCETAVAFSGTAGERIGAAFEPDLAFIDLDMVGVDGCDVARYLRQRCHKRPFCVCLTGCDPDQARQRAMQGGFDDFVSKPMDADTLLNAVETAKAVH